MDANNNAGLGMGRPTRHTPEQIQFLEAFFLVCPNPDENQRNELGNELGLTPRQVTVWFQNKRSQTRIRTRHVDNTALRSENEQFRLEIEAASELLKTALCLTCDGHAPVGEEARKPDTQTLRTENAMLKEVHETISNKVTSRSRKPISDLLALSPDSLENVLKSSAGSSSGRQSGSSSLVRSHIMLVNHRNPAAAMDFIEITEQEKEIIIANAALAVTELAHLSRTIEPLWVMSPTYGGYVLHYENYAKIFPTSNHLKSTSSRIESSKDSAVLPIAALDLIEMFRDTDKWADLFPTIVMEAKLLETLDTGSPGDSLHLMYGRMHILSPLVAPREYFYLRYCVQVDKETWFVVDAACDCFKVFHGTTPTISWRFPSGLMIESLPDRKSKVTWVEHVEVDEALTHPLYRDLLGTEHGYGATRWLSSLGRITERYLFSVMPGDTSAHQLEGGINAIEGRRNVLSLTHRMIKSFCSILSMPNKSDLLESTNRKVRVLFRDNNEPGQPRGTIVTASTSIWLPLTFENLFNFLRDENRRPEWEVMLNRSPAREIAHTPTGTHPGNRVSIIQTPTMKESNMVMLQESSVDPSGALIVYAPVDSQVIVAVLNGEDTKQIPVLPCGYLISGDGQSNGNRRRDGASTSTSTVQSRPLGSLLTLAYQFPVKDIDMETIEISDSMVISTIKKLRVILGCPDSQSS